jgi:curli biogenesis system outer membrane secretion channel CsgG
MKRELLILGFVSACGSAVNTYDSPTVVKPAYAYHCKERVTARLEVAPFNNVSGQDVRLDGLDDVLISELTRSNCFQEIERNDKKLAGLKQEIDRCDPKNPDRAYYNCASFPKKGKFLGATHTVYADVIMVAPKIAGTDLLAQFPGIGQVESKQSYTAVVINVRVADTASSEIAASSVVRAIVPAGSAGIDLGVKGATIKTAIEKHTPIGDAIMTMLGKSVEDLHDSWRATTGNGSDAGSAGSAAGSAATP